jgi:hypothetical protein
VGTPLQTVRVRDLTRLLDIGERQALRLIHERKIRATNVGTDRRPQWRMTLHAVAEYLGVDPGSLAIDRAAAPARGDQGGRGEDRTP